MPVPDGLDGERLADIRGRVARALSKEPDGPIRGAALAALGIDYDSGVFAGRVEWRRKLKKKHVLNWKEREANRTLGVMSLLWRSVSALMEFGAPQHSGWLTLGRNRDGARVIKITGRSSIGDNWRTVPTLLTDALQDIELLKYYWPTVQDKGQFAVSAPHQTVRQCVDKSFAKSWLAPLKKNKKKIDLRSPEEVERDDKQDRLNAKHRREIKSYIMRRARLLGGKALVITNKTIAQTLDFPKGSNIEVAWFNAVAGRDAWKDARLVVVLGRPQPSPSDVERMAGALTGRASETITGWYQRGDSFRLVRTGSGIERQQTEADVHPDPVAERLRARICSGELIQALGRARGVNRRANEPVEVLMLGDAVLPSTGPSATPIDEFVSVEELAVSPTDIQLSEGGVAFSSAGAVAKAYPNIWTSPDAAKKALQREKLGTKPYKNIPIGESPPLPRFEGEPEAQRIKRVAQGEAHIDVELSRPAARLRTARFKLAGQGQDFQSAVYDSGIIPDPRAAITATLGQLVQLDLVEEASDAGVMTVNGGVIFEPSPAVEPDEAGPSSNPFAVVGEDGEPETQEQYVARRLRELEDDEARGWPLSFGGRDFDDGGVIDLWQEREDRLRPPSPMPPWPENGPLDDPYYSDRQCRAGLHKGPRVLAPWERPDEEPSPDISEPEDIAAQPVDEAPQEPEEAPPIQTRQQLNEPIIVPAAAWSAVYCRAEVLGLPLQDVAQRWCQCSGFHLSNIKSGRRKCTAVVRDGLNQFLSDTEALAPKQLRLFE